MAAKEYSHPFCIIGSKGKFAPCYHDYLPPLEDKTYKEEHPSEYYIRLGLSIIKDKQAKEIKEAWYKKGSRV